MITDWWVGQRVYYHYPLMSAHKCYGNIVDWGESAGRVWFHIDFDGLGVHHYENRHGVTLIHPAETVRVEPTWEL